MTTQGTGHPWAPTHFSPLLWAVGRSSTGGSVFPGLPLACSRRKLGFWTCCVVVKSLSTFLLHCKESFPQMHVTSTWPLSDSIAHQDQDMWSNYSLEMFKQRKRMLNKIFNIISLIKPLWSRTWLTAFPQSIKYSIQTRKLLIDLPCKKINVYSTLFYPGVGLTGF